MAGAAAAGQPLQARDAWMRCRDGVRLATRVWSPAGEGPWPVLLMRQPYGRAIASTVTYAHPHWYAAHGFLVAVQDVRGRGESEGEFGGFAAEAADSADAVRWARRLPGADGRVGAYGFSYQGLSQLLNQGSPEPAPVPDPALPDCLIPAMAGLDERRHWASEGGAHWWGLGVAWALQLAAEGCRRRGDERGWQAIRRCLLDGSHPEQGLALLERHDPGGMGLGWLRLDPAEPAGWRRHEPPQPLLRRPMLLIGGWHDPHLSGILDLHRRARRAGGRPGLVVGPWTHLNWGEGLDDLQLAFFRRHLPPRGGGLGSTPAAAEGREPLPEPDAVFAATLAGGIALAAERGSDWFVPRRARSGAVEVDQSGGEGDGLPGPIGWRLRSDGRAAICTQEGRLIAAAGVDDPGPDAVVMLVHDPWRPVPARGGHLGLPAGVADRSDLDSRGDVACFSTDPLPHDRLLLGRPCLALTVCADQPGFDLCAALSLLPADGSAALQVSSGVLRVRGPSALNAVPRRLDLQPLALQLRAGERLRLSIAGAAWPAIAVNAGDGSLPRGGPGPSHRVISLALHLAGARLWWAPLLSPEADAD